jgi:hypothetical protein
MSNLDRAGRRTTYFLGAGASAAETGRPAVTANLLELALRDPPQEVPSRDVAIAREFIDFLAPDSRNPPIDDVLSIIEVAVSRNLALSSSWSPRRLAEVRRSLNRIVYDFIETVETNERPDGPLTLLLKARELSTAVITLNWDCLVERTFARLVNQPQGMVDYRLACVTPQGERFPVDAGALCVLKPHGSLSWGLCLLCGCLVADVTRPHRFTAGRRCPVCLQTELEFVLIPPVMSRESTPWFFAGLWNEVETTLRDSDHIVFIGYSFPPQDVHVRVHLLRALAQRDHRSRRAPLSVEIVTRRDVDRPHLVDVERSRYFDVFSGRVSPADLHFFAEPDGFDGWLKSRAQ